MKKYFPLIVCLFCLLFPSLILSQDNPEFREFIYKLSDAGQNAETLSHELFEKYFQITPINSDEHKINVNVIFIKENFIAIMIESYVNESVYEESSNLITYDWNGDFIDEINFNYINSNDLSSINIESEFINDNLIVKNSYSEFYSFVEVLDENGEIISYEYKLDKAVKELIKYSLDDNGAIAILSQEIINE